MAISHLAILQIAKNIEKPTVEGSSMRKKLIISAIGAQLIMMQGLQAETLALEEVIVTAEKR